MSRFTRSRSVGLLVSLLAMACAQAETGQMAVSGELKTAADRNSATVATLEAGTPLQVGQRNGAWYQVHTAQGDGWVRMLNVRLGNGSKAQGDSALSGLQALGQASRNNTTVATGIRGLKREDLRNAQEDPRELAKLAQYRVTEQEARQFGASAHLPAP